MTINKFNDNTELIDLYYRNYNSKDGSWYINISNDIKSLEKFDIKYKIYYNEQLRWYLYAVSNNYDLSDIYRFDISTYVNLVDCHDVMTNNGFKVVDKDKIELIYNTNKFNL